MGTAINPEDRPKVIILAIAIVALLGYFFVGVLPRLTGGKTAALSSDSASASAPVDTAQAAAAQPQQPSASASSQPGGAGSAGVLAANAPPVPSGTPQPYGAALVTGRNPFAPPIGLRNEVGPGQSAAPARRAPEPGLASIRFAQSAPGVAITAMHRSPRTGLPPLPMGVPAGEPAASAPAPMALKGIADGWPAVAVFKVGDRTVTVEPHEALPNGLVVSDITENGVVLRRGREVYSQEIGGPLVPGLIRRTMKAQPERQDAARPPSGASLGTAVSDQMPPRSIQPVQEQRRPASAPISTGSLAIAAPESDKGSVQGLPGPMLLQVPQASEPLPGEPETPRLGAAALHRFLAARAGLVQPTGRIQLIAVYRRSPAARRVALR